MASFSKFLMDKHKSSLKKMRITDKAMRNFPQGRMNWREIQINFTIRCCSVYGNDDLIESEFGWTIKKQFKIKKTRKYENWVREVVTALILINKSILMFFNNKIHVSELSMEGWNLLEVLATGEGVLLARGIITMLRWKILHEISIQLWRPWMGFL